MKFWSNPQVPWIKLTCNDSIKHKYQGQDLFYEMILVNIYLLGVDILKRRMFFYCEATTAVKDDLQIIV